MNRVDFTRTKSGRIAYSVQTVCRALKVERRDCAPHVYETAAVVAQRDGRHLTAAYLYLAAALVSAGQSRTAMYEELAEARARAYEAELEDDA